VISLTAEEAGRALGCERLCAPVTGVSIDSRTIAAGDLFVALKGEAHDGHDHVQDALARGASGAVVREDFAQQASLPSSCLYRVPDTGEALGALAAAVRMRSRAVVVGVTGSVGKTSTKDILRTMASTAGPVTYTLGNQNNEVGVPLTLFNLTEETRIAVVEMGMRGHGQIAQLSSWARPDVALITKVAPVHLELLGDLAQVARAKAEIFSGLSSRGIGVIPWQAPFLDVQVASADHPVVRFGFGPLEEAADVWGMVVRDGSVRRLKVRWPEGEGEVKIPWASRHRFENAIGALAACRAAGLNVESCLQVLPETVFTPLRGDELLVGGVLILDDTYNSNPHAVRSALDTLKDRAAEMGGRAVAVLGDMLELGVDSQSYHREVGLYAAECGVDVLWAVGTESKALVQGYSTQAPAHACSRHVEGLDDGSMDAAEVANSLILRLRMNDVVLLKASRGVRLERVAAELKGQLARAVEPLPTETASTSPCSGGVGD
jgi:UDP-N-acetylmuramoyl-tripeptide--D-alanyl-D-alanine ligase